MASKDTSLGTIKLKNVRLSFAHLYEPQEGKVDKDTGKKGEPKYNCSLLFSKTTPEGKANRALVSKAAEEVKSAKWGKNPPKLKPEKVCMRDGDQEDYDGYEGMLFVSASSPANRPPVLIDRRKDEKGKWMKAHPGLLYSGCYVNAIINIWAQDNEHGKRINASIESVQFLRRGDAFGAKPVDADEAFSDDDVGEEDDENEDEDEDENEDDLI